MPTTPPCHSKAVVMSSHILPPARAEGAVQLGVGRAMTLGLCCEGV